MSATDPYGYLKQVTGDGLVHFNFVGPSGTKAAQCELAYNSHGGFGFPGFPASLSAAGDANTWATLWANNIMPFQASDCVLNSVDVTLWDGTNLQQATSTNTPIAGGGAAPPLPPAVAMIVDKKSGQLGRANRGRLFVPYITPALADPVNDGVANSLMVGVQTSLNNFNVAINAAEFTPKIIRKTENPLVTPYHQIDITEFVVVQRFGTQRGRQRKRAHR